MLSAARAHVLARGANAAVASSAGSTRLLVTALDGVDEFLLTCFSTSSPWPHEPAVVDYRVTEGGAWRIALSANGARVVETGGGAVDASAETSAHDLLMVLYGRGSTDSWKIDGNAEVFVQLGDWVPDWGGGAGAGGDRCGKTLPTHITSGRCLSIGEALREFQATGVRPDCVKWQDADAF